MQTGSERLYITWNDNSIRSSAYAFIAMSISSVERSDDAGRNIMINNSNNKTHLFQTQQRCYSKRDAEMGFFEAGLWDDATSKR